jgi:hypothetical protein
MVLLEGGLDRMSANNKNRLVDHLYSAMVDLQTQYFFGDVSQANQNQNTGMQLFAGFQSKVLSRTSSKDLTDGDNVEQTIALDPVEGNKETLTSAVKTMVQPAESAKSKGKWCFRCRYIEGPCISRVLHNFVLCYL